MVRKTWLGRALLGLVCFCRPSEGFVALKGEPTRTAGTTAVQLPLQQSRAQQLKGSSHRGDSAKTKLFMAPKATKKTAAPKKKAAAAASAVAATTDSDALKKADLVADLANSMNTSKKDAETALESVLDVIVRNVSAGRKVSLPGFGTFQLRARAARTGRNPQTGEAMQIAASQAVSFTPSKTWKDAVKNK